MIFLFSYYIRSVNITPDRLLSFDPAFYYRYTKYVVDYGHLPVWDELSYYVGRLIENDNAQPFMVYLTAAFYVLILKGIGMSLLTAAAYMSAIYGALIVIPAYLIVKELSNKYGGLIGAFLMGTAPQILVRTFGGSYDNDQLVTFFILLTLYAGLYAFRKRNITSLSFSIITFTAFMMMWGFSMYTFLILSIFVVMYILTYALIKDKEKKTKASERLREAFKLSKSYFVYLIALFVGLILTSTLIGSNLLFSLGRLVGFAQQAEQWIVNISIAELQPFTIFSIAGWILSMGRFVIGENFIDIFLFLIFVSMMGFSLYYNYKKKNRKEFAFLFTLLLIGIYTTFRGIRFTEFTSALFLIIISAGFAYFWEWSRKDNFTKTISLGIVIFVVLLAGSIGIDMGKQLGPDVNPNWDNAWNFLKTQTPEFSLIGTWWDPGHMITGYGERRVIADGAHCQLASNGKDACFYTINDRIVDLGRIMATDNESVSMNLIRKYQGDSNNVYWIASDDLIGKFQWLQYFGLGCDARVESRCPLYIQLGLQNSYAVNNLVVRNYGSALVLRSNPPVALLLDGRNAILFPEVIFYDEFGAIRSYSITNKTAAINSLKPLERSLNVVFVDRDLPYSIWIDQNEGYVVLIPPTLRNSVFTKMFMLEGSGLQHFKQVFRNNQVKIYEVV